MSLEPKSPYSIPLYSQESNLVNRQQQEAERRLVQLLKFSSSTESLRTDTELAKKMVKNQNLKTPKKLLVDILFYCYQD